MAQRRARHEFRVVIDGADLSQDAVQRINAAVQKAALTELATVDLAGDYRFRLPLPHPQPPWWGLWLQRLSKEQLDRAGLETPAEFGG